MKTPKFNADKIYTLQPEDLIGQFILVEGEQGVGKTAELTAFARVIYKKLNKKLMRDTIAYTEMLNSTGDYNLKLAKHCIFSNFDILLDAKKNVHTHFIDMSKLGLPNLDFKVQYFPRGSIILIQEAALLAYCRDYKTLNRYLINLLRYFRHFKLTVIFDCQTIEDLDKAIRKLIVWDFYIDYRICHKKWFCKPVYIWHFYRIRNQLNNRIAKLSQMGVKINIPIVQECVFKCKGYIHDFYDSFEAVPYFLKGLVQYEFLPHPKKSLDRKSVEEYCKAHPLVNMGD